MEKPSTLFTGIFGAFLLSASVMVILPHRQLSGLQPTVGEWDGTTPSPTDVYPVKIEGGLGQRLGQRIYMENGCFYCHSQQIRDPQYGPDMLRGWGPRRTVARDYIYESVPLLGSLRMGPDLTNYGWTTTATVNNVETKVPAWRNEPVDDPKKPALRDANWIYKHLYHPTVIVKESSCPPMPGLFEWVDIGSAPSSTAVAKDGNRQLVPTADARNLALYLLSLNRTHELKEAPTKIKPQEAKK